MPPARPRWRRTWIQVGASITVLASALYFVDRAEIWRCLHQMQAGWLALTLVILLAQFVVMATRWWFFARKLSAPIGYAQALAEYFLAGLLNQVMPLGILGDVTRAIRHAQATRVAAKPSQNNERVVLAIVLERVAGQIALWVVVAAILPAWWAAGSTGKSLLHGFLTGLVGFLLIALVGIALLVWRRQATPQLRHLVSEGFWVLFAPRNLATHLPLSLLLVATHTLAFVTIAHGLGLQLPLQLAFRVVPIVLVATTLPLFIAGWGVREATVAGLYHLAGLRAAEGVSIAIVYGCLSLLASVPGVLALRRGAKVPYVPQGRESTAL